MTSLTVLGYLVLFLLIWVGLSVLALTTSRAWYMGKAQAESQALQDIRRLVLAASLNSKATGRYRWPEQVIHGVGRWGNEEDGYIRRRGRTSDPPEAGELMVSDTKDNASGGRSGPGVWPSWLRPFFQYTLHNSGCFPLFFLCFSGGGETKVNTCYQTGYPWTTPMEGCEQ